MKRDFGYNKHFRRGELDGAKQSILCHSDENPITAEIVAGLKSEDRRIRDKARGYLYGRSRINIHEVFAGYLTAAFATTNDEKTPSGGESLDRNYSADDLRASAKFRMLRDVEIFVAENEALLMACTVGREKCAGYAFEHAQIGIDFWCDRNGVGVGFWEDDYSVAPQGDTLSASAKKFGTADLYVYRGKIYHY